MLPPLIITQKEVDILIKKIIKLIERLGHIMTKHFIDFDNLSFEVLQDIIDRAIALKKQHNKGVINNSLKNKTLAMIFDKSSTRTRVSFEAGMTQLRWSCSFSLKQ